MKQYKKLMMIMSLGAIALVGCTTNDSTANTTNTTNVEKEEQKVENETMAISHKYGDVEVPINPSSVAVFDFGVLDTLQRLGVEVVTGVVQDGNSRPEYLDEYGSQEYTNIGGLKEPNFEALYELKPEIIFISGRQASHYEELSKIAPVVFMEADKNDYMGSLRSNVETLAKIFVKEEVAEGILSELEAKVDEVATQVEGNGLNALITMVSKGEVSVFGEGSRFGVLYNAFGFEPSDKNIDDANHGQVVTFEYLAQIDPEYLFVVDKNSIEGSNETAKDTLNNPLVMEISAAKADQITYLDPIAWYISPGGITASEQMIEDVQGALN